MKTQNLICYQINNYYIDINFLDFNAFLLAYNSAETHISTKHKGKQYNIYLINCLITVMQLIFNCSVQIYFILFHIIYASVKVIHITVDVRLMIKI